MKTAIIGAGLAGLACATRLKAGGMAPVLFDKGRGIGGRLSTRRTDGGFRFDHGAQYLTARDAGFAEVLARAEADGAVARWLVDGEERGFVGLPGMSGLARYLAQGLDIRQGVEITALDEGPAGWRLALGDGAETFDRVVVTAPAPQTVRLLGDGHPMAEALAPVRMDPCLTLMIALPATFSPPFTIRRDPDADVSWIALDSAKPGRPEAVCFVAQAGPDWSRRHLELERDEIARRMLPIVCGALAADPDDALYVAAHRWRYALASTPLGRPFATDSGRTILAGGDWCLGDRAEAAWLSGTAIADALLSAG